MAMMTIRLAAEHFNAQAAAVLAQRARLRGHPPPGDLFDGIAPDHPIMTADPHGGLDANLTIIASLLEPDDTIVDVGGGVGRISLPLALRCRELVNVEPSATMCSGFDANVERAGIENARSVQSLWPMPDPPIGTVALVNHVMYLERNVEPFIEQLELAGPRRVINTLNDPAPPTWHHRIYELLHGEPEAFAPGHVELVNVLWEMGRRADVRYLGPPGAPPAAEPAIPATDPAVAPRSRTKRAARRGSRETAWASSATLVGAGAGCVRAWDPSRSASSGEASRSCNNSRAAETPSATAW